MTIDEIAATPLATQCVHAMWALENIDDELARLMEGKDIHELFSWALEVATREDQSDIAQRVYAEAVARRIEGK